MSSKETTFSVLWERFNHLAGASDEERYEAYRGDGMEFLDAFLIETIVSYGNPEIHSAEDFSEFIVTLRANYKDWNQHLMGLMARFDATDTVQSRQSLCDFIASSPWIHLIEAAQGFLDSRL